MAKEKTKWVDPEGLAGLGHIPAVRRAYGRILGDEDDFCSPNPEISGKIRYINKHFYVHAGCQEQIFDNINELLNWIGAELTKQIKIHEAAEKELKEEREKSGWEDPFAANRREEEGGE